MKNKQKTLFLSLFFASISFASAAHDVVKDIEKMSKSDAAIQYLGLGFQHILPLGYDHILFIIGLFLLSPNLKTILWQTTAFTVAHSLTLALVSYKIILPPPSIVEPLIAISILFIAIENIFIHRLKTSRILLIFLFGLIHGMGFAGVLSELGLPPNAYLLSLLMFNIGVEIGQLAIVLSAYFLLRNFWNNPLFYKKNIVKPISISIALISIYWTIERLSRMTNLE